MKKLNCIAIDDEPLSLKQMTNYIDRVESLELKQSFTNAFEALNYLQTHEVDLVFLDIEMNEMTGVDLVESLNVKPHFIFTTAYDHYALKAFELQAADYLQKPISFKRFVKAVDKVFRLQPRSYPDEGSANQKSGQKNKDFIFIKTKYRMQKLSFDDIYYIKGMNNYLVIKTRDETLYTIQSFNHISTVLPQENFIRIHKSYVVAIDKIDVIGKNRLFINEQNIPIGESY
ncbi:MAG: response regulator transcription factor, partial [Bacteroidales bacterium]|nr:response regulator transcription factor [Bacteroidales bacterium]